MAELEAQDDEFDDYDDGDDLDAYSEMLADQAYEAEIAGKDIDE